MTRPLGYGSRVKGFDGTLRNQGRGPAPLGRNVSLIQLWAHAGGGGFVKGTARNLEGWPGAFREECIPYSAVGSLREGIIWNPRNLGGFWRRPSTRGIILGCGSAEESPCGMLGGGPRGTIEENRRFEKPLATGEFFDRILQN